MAEQRQKKQTQFYQACRGNRRGRDFRRRWHCGAAGNCHAGVSLHNDRTRGWLRFIWEKATTPDDWGYREELNCPGAFKSRAAILTGMTMVSARTPGGTSMLRRPCSVTDGLIWPTRATRCC